MGSSSSKIEGATEYPTETQSNSTTYPLKGRKIQQITRQDIEVFEIGLNHIEIKIISTDNIFTVKTYRYDKNGSIEITLDCEKDELYTRVLKSAYKIFNGRSYKKSYTFKLNCTLKDLHEKNYEQFIKFINDKIDYVEKYAEFKKTDIDLLLSWWFY